MKENKLKTVYDGHSEVVSAINDWIFDDETIDLDGINRGFDRFMEKFLNEKGVYKRLEKIQSLYDLMVNFGVTRYTRKRILQEMRSKLAKEAIKLITEKTVTNEPV